MRSKILRKREWKKRRTENESKYSKIWRDSRRI